MSRILVADDEPFILRSLSFALHREGHEVCTARNGTEAHTALANTAFDLAFIDVVMPGLNGFEVVERLRTEQGCLRTHVVFLTAKGTDEDHNRGLALGASAYLNKPFSPAALGRLVSEVLAGPPPGAR
ncbi:MAG: response regulator [Planctomycetota bacterium]